MIIDKIGQGLFLYAQSTGVIKNKLLKPVKVFTTQQTTKVANLNYLPPGNISINKNIVEVL